MTTRVLVEDGVVMTVTSDAEGAGPAVVDYVDHGPTIGEDRWSVAVPLRRASAGEVSQPLLPTVMRGREWEARTVTRGFRRRERRWGPRFARGVASSLSLARSVAAAARVRRLWRALSLADQMTALVWGRNLSASVVAAFVVAGCAFWGAGYEAVGRAYLWLALAAAVALVWCAGRAIRVERAASRLEAEASAGVARALSVDAV